MMKGKALIKYSFIGLLVVAITFVLAEFALRWQLRNVIRPFDFVSVQMLGFPQRPHLKDEAYEAMRRFSQGKSIDTTLFELTPELRKYGEDLPETDFLYHNSDRMVQNEVKQWNHNFVKHTFQLDSFHYRIPLFRGYKARKIYVFPAYDGTEYPAYRYFPNSIAFGGKLRFNRYGWTGSDVALAKPAHIIRIAFLGGSTTQQNAGFDFSYPDYIERWLNEWAKRQQLNVNFEIINVGRVAQRSMDFVNIFKYEVLPVQPDIVVYYEGRNQFDLESLTGFKPYRSFDFNPFYLVTGHSILAQAAINRLGLSYYNLLEHRKGPLQVNWPAAVNEQNPTPGNPALPVQLNQISNDINAINALLDTAHQTLMLSSFAMQAEDSTLSKPNYNYIYAYWLHDFGKVPMPLIRRLNKFENSFFKRLAEDENLPFADVANVIEGHPDFFDDGIHLNPEGMRLQAWVIFERLLPVIENKLKSGALPYNNGKQLVQHPYLKSDAFLLNLDSISHY